MATGIYSWSQTAATNSTADSAINWAEGQAPSTVNDSARGMMSVLAKWRDDISGVQPSNVVQTSGGAADVQTLTSNGSIAALTNGWTVTFKAGFSNTGACTLNVDSTGAKAIERISGTDLVGGEIMAGAVYTVTYHQPSDSWLMRSTAITNPSIVLLTSGSVSASASQAHVISAYTGYRMLRFIYTDIAVSTDATDFYLRTSTDGGSTYDSTSGHYQYAYQRYNSNAGDSNRSSNSAAQIQLADSIGNSTGEGANISVDLYSPDNATFYTMCTFRSIWVNGSNNLSVGHGTGCRADAADVDAVQFLVSAGTFSADYVIYGVL